MVRWVSAVLLGFGLVACTGEEEYDPSSATDPTADFVANPPDVDTARPTFDTGYPGTRRRALDTGWRLRRGPADTDTGSFDTGE